jgi:hypothetical protein
MRATGWQSGGGVILGFRVGKQNALKSFRREWKSVTLELGDEVVDVRLSPAFWRDCPELKSREISTWMKLHRLFPWARGKTPNFELVEVGTRRFKVSVLRQDG